MFPAQAAAFPTEVSGNYYYNLADTFFYDKEVDKCPSSDEFPESSAVAGGGAVLTADPCENSVRGIFNVTDAAVLAAQAGDPRWLVAYVPEPMADLVPVEYGYKWNLTDKSAFGQSVDATSVINNLKFIVDENPVNILDNGMEFTAEAALQYGGVPTDCAISFMVSGPGSIFASTALSSSGSSNDHLTVALGDAEGNGAEVVGAVYAGATNQKLVFEDIPAGENRLVYVYACGPVVLTAMEWSDDVNTGSSALKDPEVTADVSTAGALKLSWPAVENAGSYIISFGSKEADAEYAEDEYTVTATSPEYTWENFPSGTYTVNVQAVPAEPDKFDNSMIVGTSVTVAAPALTNMTSGTLTQDDFRFISAVVGTDKLAKGHVITYKNFMFTENKGDKVSFGVDSNFGAYYSTGGSSSVKADAAEASQTIRFLAAGAGKLTVVATSTSTLDPEKPRRVSYGINGTKSDVLYEVPGKPSGALDPETSTFSFDISAAAGDAIDIYGDANIYVMNVTWEPSGQLPPVAGLTPVTEATIWGGDVWGKFYELRTDQSIGYGKDFAIAENSAVIDNLMIYAGGEEFRVAEGNEYIQLTAKSFDEGADPATYDKSFFRFRASGNGTLTVSARATNGSGQPERNIYVAVGGSADEVTVGTVQEGVYNAGSFTKLDQSFTWNITANNGDSITIFANNALRVGEVTWTPAE